MAPGSAPLPTKETQIAPVSVIVPCYRCKLSISRALESIAHQALPAKEVILVDDGSGDDTLEVLKELARKHPGWIKVIALNENKGPACARNAGWDAAREPYIAFLDADDSWHPEKLRIQVEYMCSNPDVALSGHQFYRLRDEEVPRPIAPIPAVTRISPVSLTFKNWFLTPTVMLRRELPFRFSENRRYSEDLALWQQIAFAGLELRRIEAPLAFAHKALYGASGLSAHLWEMEKGELVNLIDLHRKNNINTRLFVAAYIFSIAKFCIRLITRR